MTELIFWGASGLVTYTYLVFPLVLLVRALIRPRETSATDVALSLSVVIAARDEAARISRKLESILSSDYPGPLVEVIVASDGSTDATEDVVESYSARGVRLIRLPARGKAAALNAAVAAAGGEILVFTDAGGELDPQALRMLLRPFADGSVGGVAGDQRYVAGPAAHALGTGERRYWGFDRWLKRAEARGGNVISATGALYAIRRELYEPVPADVTDDAFLSMGVIANGFRLAFASGAVALEPLAPGARTEIERKVRVMTRGLRTVWARRQLLNPLRYGFYSLELFTHKLLRRLMVFPLGAVLVSSLLLWNAGAIFGLAVLAQIALYAAGALGLVLARTHLGRLPPLALPAYFLVVNAAALLALANLMRGRSIESWRPTGAQESPRSVADEIELLSSKRSGRRPEWVVAAVVASATGVATGMLPVPVAAFAVVAALGAVMLLSTNLSTYVVIGLIYTNATVVAVHSHGAPSIVGLLIPMLLVVSLFHYFLVRWNPVVIVPVLPFVVGFLAVQAASAMQARNGIVALREIVTFLVEGLGLFFIITNAVRTREVLHRCVRVLLVLAAVLSAFAFFRVVTGNFEQDFLGFAQTPRVAASDDLMPAGESEEPRREFGPIGDPNRFAQFLLPLIPLGLGVASLSRTRHWRYATVGAVWLVLGGVILTFSRGAFLGLAVSVALLLTMRQVKGSHLAAGIGFLVVLVVTVPAYRERITSILDSTGLLAEGESASADNSIQGRYTEVAAAAFAFADHPWLGVGPGNFEFHYREYANRAPARVHSGERQAHNLYLGVAAETGLPGLVLLLGVFLVTLRELVRAQRRAPDDEGKALAAKFIVVVAGLMVTSIFLHFAFIRYFWLFMALASVAARVAAPRVPSARVQSDESIGRSPVLSR